MNKIISNRDLDELTSFARAIAYERINGDCYPFSTDNFAEALSEASYSDKASPLYIRYLAMTTALRTGDYATGGEIAARIAESYWTQWVIDLAEGVRDKEIEGHHSTKLSDSFDLPMLPALNIRGTV